MDKDSYKKAYSKKELFRKMKKVFEKAGVSVVYGALLLFYTLKDPEIPVKAKSTIIGALGYFILPLDLVADTLPVVGYGDDLTAIITALYIISAHITPKIKKKAKKKTKELFNNVKEKDFNIIDDKISRACK